jgi:hypothetical protein
LIQGGIKSTAAPRKERNNKRAKLGDVRVNMASHRSTRRDWLSEGSRNYTMQFFSLKTKTLILIYDIAMILCAAKMTSKLPTLPKVVTQMFEHKIAGFSKIMPWTNALCSIVPMPALYTSEELSVSRFKRLAVAGT